MGQYTTEALVASELDNIKFTATSKVTTAELTEFITQEENTLNAAIGSKYLTPILIGASPIAHSIMKTIATYLVGYRVLKIVKPEEADGTITKEGEKTTFGKVSLKVLAFSMIKKVKSGELFFPDADQVSDQVASFQTKNTVETAQFRITREDLW